MSIATMAMSYLDISTMAVRYSVSLRTLRFYESQGLLTPVRHGNARLYSHKDCVRLEIILKGKRLGFSLREIASLMQGAAPIAEDRESALIERMTAQQLQDQIEVLRERRASIDLALPELEAALKRHQ